MATSTSEIRRRGLRRWVAVLAMVGAASMACGPAATDDPAATQTTETAPASSLPVFCQQWAAVWASDAEDRVSANLRDAPADIADEVEIVVTAEPRHDEERTEADRSAEQSAYAELERWTEVNCYAADPHRRYVAPPADAQLPGLNFCHASTSPVDDDGRAQAHLYGQADLADPYTGRMLGILWHPREDDDSSPGFGDGEQQDVTVRGMGGIAEPLTVSQQVVLEDLGTALSWHEKGLRVTLIGRFWRLKQVDELIALANALEYRDGVFGWPTKALPDGYEQVFLGPAESMFLMGPHGVRYFVQYRSAESDYGILNVTGRNASPDEFEAFMFLTKALRRERLGDRDVLIGDPWGTGTGLAVLTWRERDGLVVRVVGATEREVVAAAEQTRQLDPEEWVELVDAPNNCPERVAPLPAEGGDTEGEPGTATD